MVLIAAVLWGTTGTAQTYIAGESSPIAVSMLRSIIGGGLLLLIVVCRKQINWRKWQWGLTITAALAIAAFQSLFFTSVQLTGVAVGTVVTIGSAPIFAGIIEWLFWKVQPTIVWGIATLFSIVGAFLLVSSGGETVINPLGVIVALAAGFLFALYTNISKQLMRLAQPLPAVALVFTICGLSLLPLSVTQLEWVMLQMNGVIILYLAIFTCSIAYWLYLTGLKRISSSSAVTLSLAEPLTAAMLGVFLVGEYLSKQAWSGVSLLFSGILILTFFTRR